MRIAQTIYPLNTMRNCYSKKSNSELCTNILLYLIKRATMALREVQLTGMVPEVRNQNTVLVQFEA